VLLTSDDGSAAGGLLRGVAPDDLRARPIIAQNIRAGSLAAFQGELDTQWHYLLAMTVVALLPVIAIFAFLQKYVTTGIATTGLK
jgi:hypothetical protein